VTNAPTLVRETSRAVAPPGTTEPQTSAQGQQPRSAPVQPRPRRILPEAWPAYVFLFGYGITWLLGFGEMLFVVLSIPMLGSLIRKRRIMTPPGFGIWLLFLAWMLASGYMAGKTTIGLDVSNAAHYSSWALRVTTYLSATIGMLYVLNTPREALPAKTVVRGLGALFVLTVAGGYLGLLAPHLSFSTPMEVLLPKGLGKVLADSVHPQVAQVQGVLGFESSRPSAPFSYTNSWGGNLSLFLPYFVLGWLSKSERLRRRVAGAVILLASLVPIVYSLNRGLWVNIGIAALAAGVLLALRGRVRLLLLIAIAPLIVGVALLGTPLHTIVSDRLAHGHSDQRRAGLANLAFQGALKSPILGWGTTRDSPGSNQSIAVGQSADCKSCGTPPTGTHGHLYLLIFAQGFPGAFLWFAFFGFSLWRFRRGRSPLYLTAAVALTVFIVATLYYNALSAPQFYMMVVIGILARDERLEPDEVLAGPGE
jgi:hypothetical protein